MSTSIDDKPFSLPEGVVAWSSYRHPKGLGGERGFQLDLKSQQ